MNLVVRTRQVLDFSAFKIKIFRLRVFTFVSSGWEGKSCDPLDMRKGLVLNYFLNVLIISPLPILGSKTAKTPILMMTLCRSQMPSVKVLEHYQGHHRLDMKWQERSQGKQLYCMKICIFFVYL